MTCENLRNPTLVTTKTGYDWSKFEKFRIRFRSGSVLLRLISLRMRKSHFAAIDPQTQTIQCCQNSWKSSQIFKNILRTCMIGRIQTAELIENWTAEYLTRGLNKYKPNGWIWPNGWILNIVLFQSTVPTQYIKVYPQQYKLWYIGVIYRVNFQPNGYFQPSSFLFIRPSCQFFSLPVFYLFGLPDSAQWISSLWFRRFSKLIFAISFLILALLFGAHTETRLAIINSLGFRRPFANFQNCQVVDQNFGCNFT